MSLCLAGLVVVLYGALVADATRRVAAAPPAVVSATDDGSGGTAGLPPAAPIDVVVSTPTPEPTLEPTATAQPLPTATPAPLATAVAPARAAPIPPAASVPVAPTSAAAAALPSVALTAFEQQFYDLHNAARSRAGLAGLRIDPTLTSVARQRAQDMAARNYFSHTSPTGQTAYTLLAGAGYGYVLAGENIARNDYADSQSVSVAMNALLNSPSHLENILDRQFTNVGVGIAFGANGMKYFAVVFSAR